MTQAGWTGANPVIWLALFGGIAAFAWELLQMPFYQTDGLTSTMATLRCGLASLGDSGIMVLAYLTASIGSSQKPWVLKPTVSRVGVYLLVGLTITAFIEHFAIRSEWGWSYSPVMPLLPGTSIGLVPILMWMVVPTFALFLARCVGLRNCNRA